MYGERVNRNPYDTQGSYFECIGDGNTFLQTEKGKEIYTLYFFIEDTLTELGVRVLSPVPELTSPNKGHIATEDFINCKNRSEGFNSFVSISTADQIHEKKELSTLATQPTWNVIGENDDSKEMDNPENSLLRIVNGKTDIYLAPGLYRIQISSATKKALKGSFLLQTGTLPAIQLSPLVSDWRKL